MRQFSKAGVALLAGLAGIGCGGSALAQSPPSGQNEPQGAQPGQHGMTAPRGEGQKTEDQQGKPQKGLGAGIAGQGEPGGGFVLGPLETGGTGAGAGQGYGAGIGQVGEVGEPGRLSSTAPAPVPQYWLADASLFVANAGNAAQTLANEQTLGVQAPSVLGNQAQFLLAATERAISSLASLQANAEATNPKAVPEIRSAMEQLTAAKGQAQQVLDAANAGTIGPSHQSTIRSAYEHLQSAERNMAAVGREYGAQGFTLASSCVFRAGRGLGAGIGGKAAPGGAQKAPEKAGGEKPQEKGAQPEKSAPPEEKGTQPAPEPPGGAKP
jgi:hypothetical protein